MRPKSTNRWPKVDLLSPKVAKVRARRPRVDPKAIKSKSSRPKVVRSRQKVTQSLVKSSQVLSSLVKSGRQKSAKPTLRSLYEKPIRKQVFACEHLLCFVFDKYISDDNFCLLCVFFICAHRFTFGTTFGRLLDPKISKAGVIPEPCFEVLAPKAPQWAPKAPQ